MKQRNLPLIIGILLPLVFIIIISVVIFTPSFLIKPQNNFLYSNDSNYYGYNQFYRNNYTIKDSHLKLEAVPLQANQVSKGDAPILYLYDVKSDSTHQITFEEAKNYSIDPGPSSPEGYIVKYEYNNDGIFELFGSRDNGNGYFIEKGNGKKRLSGMTDGDRYSYQGAFKFIGWIK